VSVPALPARSVILSVLLGSHPPELAVRTLVRTVGLFGISDGTARVALSRLAADGEVISDGGVYRLSERHLARQRAQDAAVRPGTRPSWDGAWELLTGPPSTPSPVESVAVARRMARFGPGVWVRPDNLTLPFADLPPGAVVWVGRPAAGSIEAADRLWDLAGWAGRADDLMTSLEAAATPAERLGIAAAMVRHMRDDPLLPPALLPPSWPGAALRRAYDAYRGELGELIEGLRSAP
jgi:phenylacetic acid degradation operon negative regulatory protein